jgi:hypothetical protein
MEIGMLIISSPSMGLAELLPCGRVEPVKQIKTNDRERLLDRTSYIG